MEIDLELYRRDINLVTSPGVSLSLIDIFPDYPEQTMVFIHGFGGRASHWIFQLQEFSTRNRVIAMDLRGHGRSSKPNSTYSMQEIQSDLETMLDVLGVSGKFVLVGHSFGGAVASQFAHDHPERIERLVLIAAAGEYRLNPLYRLSLNLPTTTLRLINPLTRKWLGAPAHVLQLWYHNNLAKWNGWSLFRSLTIPTLVIRGHLDIVLEKPLFEEVARAIPNAEEIDVGYSGHMVMLERRQAVNRAIDAFLSEAPRSWRDEDSKASQSRSDKLKSRRPWLAFYGAEIPNTIAVPRVPLSSLLLSAARRFPNHTALIFEGKKISYHNLEQKAHRFAKALLAMGLTRGDRVLILLPNLPQAVIAFYGTLMAGCVAVFTLPNTDPSELTRQVSETGTKVLVTLEEMQPVAHQLAQVASLQHIIYTTVDEFLPWNKRLLKRFLSNKQQRMTYNTANSMQFRQLISKKETVLSDAEVSPQDLAVIMYTGGTTAKPKGVMLSHYNLVANMLQVRHWMPEAKEGKERFLCALSFSHSYGMTTALNVPIALGALLILKAKFEVKDVLQTIKRHHPTVFPGVPSMYVAINNTPGVRKYGIRSVRACISGSAPLPVEVQEAFERLTRGRLVEGYGLTEASPVTHANPLDGVRKVGSIGIPLPSTEARIVDLVNGNKSVPEGQFGELAVRGPQVMMGYWHDPEATGDVLKKDGWLLTGDVAQMDADGYFRLIARKADMWYPSKPGNPAFPRDVEEVLYEIPQIVEAAVVAIAGQPVAFIITKKEKPTREAVLAYCKRRLPPELVPRLIIFLDDFPRTFIGKVLRRELARHFIEQQGEEK